ncbi:hypothetical protein NN3_32060 [Nocardia neocaledoniensis NBRC 108232]|uniref:Secreted protein n=1 Tax=Nocardia neocaledoniensis TaxID=236511 RepID=A0A317NZT5_9NOCA|nr:hypothetical protein [Nocardia neocaledoniensis]PWV80721.1 hypothetical protein DFR69_10157 [Nocardia neocaledoniensis]GEM32199.1 hypothetical protein NN3_32060 [Nocardia neocaledoniensis NBRC 108232]
MSTKLASVLLATAALTLPLSAAPAVAAAPSAEPVSTGSAELPAAFLDLLACLVQLPPSASGDPSQGCDT